MTTKHKLVTGAVAVASAAALYTAAAPVSAASPDAKGTTTVSVKSEGVTAKGACNSWKNAVGIPGKWSKSKYGCAIFGKPGLKVTYRWAAERGTPCIKVKGFVKGGPKGFKTKWYNAGCGKTGAVKVPWGNVLDDREIQIKGASLLKWR